MYVYNSHVLSSLQMTKYLAPFIQIFETFGPTQQPMYQVKFNSAYPLDPEKVQVSRAVFHVPQRSRFIFVSQVKKLKGSDASNVHDEEPADDELEFSDDEAEAAWKSAKKQQYVIIISVYDVVNCV
jgi:H/ACA ribonucleoprotein complex non-core subunit NAF1